MAQVGALSFRGGWGVWSSAQGGHRLLLLLQDGVYPCARATDAHLHLAEAEASLPPAQSGCQVAYGIDPKPTAGKRSQVGRKRLTFVFKFIDFRPNEPEAAIKSSLRANSEMAAMSS